MSLLGIDIGTTGVKASIFSESGEYLGYAYKEYPIIYPRKGWAELDPIVIWGSIVFVINEAVKMNETNDEVSALSVSAMGEVAVPISKDGSILYNAIIHFDDRGYEQSIWLGEKIGKEKIFSITGMPLHSMYTINKLLWLKENENELYKKIKKFMLFEDFFFFKLGLCPVINFSLAARTMAFDIMKKDWSEEVLDICGINKDIFSEVVPSGTLIGKLSRNSASELGLREGVAVIAGSHDNTAGAIGSGVIKEGIAMDATGTVEALTVAVDKPILSKNLLESNISCYCHAYPNMYVVSCFIFSAGSILRWFRDNFAQFELEKSKKLDKDVYNLILESVNKNPSPVIILPHFYGSGAPTMDAKSKGAVLGLTLETTRGDIIKAILEGICYEMRINIDIMKNNGINIKEIHAIGGGAKSKKWVTLKADIYDIPIKTLNITEAACLGAAMLAGKGVGIYKSLDEAVDIFVREKDAYSPSLNKTKMFLHRLSVYSKVYPKLKKLNYEIGTI